MLASYTTILTEMLRRGIEPLRSLGPVVLQTPAFPLGHLSEVENILNIQFSNNENSEPEPNLLTASETAPLLNSLFRILFEIWEREDRSR